MESQVIEWKLPPAPAKDTDSRTKNWNGLGQVELDAVEPRMLQNLCKEAILSVFNDELHDELLETEESETAIYKREMKKFIENI